MRISDWSSDVCSSDLITQKRGDPIVFDHDEGYRADASIESLAALRPLEGGVVTVGNASQQNDGAAACLLVAEDRLAELGLQPSGWFVGWAAAGCDPSRRSEEHTSELQSLMRISFAV